MTDHSLVSARDELSEYWHSQRAVWHCRTQEVFGTAERFSAFCLAKDWLQDTSEALLAHRQRGFTDDPRLFYVEFLGILQLAVVQQDALIEMNFALTGEGPDCEKVIRSEGRELRDLRDRAAGHPTRKDRGTGRRIIKTTTSRNKKSYERIDLMTETDGQRKHSTINLGKRLDRYDDEAGDFLRGMLPNLRNLLERR